jgi:predicted GIY-YIG superfamily endonuclease
MTRFKEQRRIEQAIKHQNMNELLWAIEYCKMRLSLSTMKEHKKHWQKQKKKLEESLNTTRENEI